MVLTEKREFIEKCWYFAKLLAKWADIFCGSSGDYYLSIGHEKSMFWGLFSIFDYLGHFGNGHHAGSLMHGA